METPKNVRCEEITGHSAVVTWNRGRVSTPRYIKLNYCRFVVCLSVYLSARNRLSQNAHIQILPNFLYVLPLAVAQSSSDGSVIPVQYVLRVL